MRRRKSILPYLLLNIAISALTTLLVLWLWDLTHSNPPAQSSTQPAQIAQVAAPTLPPLDQPVVKIASVIGAGKADSEMVQIERVGQGDLWLTGWVIEDSDGNQYIFPRLNFIGGTITLYTRQGVDTPVALFWKKDQSVWQTGETARLKDSRGNTRAEFLIR